MTPPPFAKIWCLLVVPVAAAARPQWSTRSRVVELASKQVRPQSRSFAKMRQTPWKMIYQETLEIALVIHLGLHQQIFAEMDWIRFSAANQLRKNQLFLIDRHRLVWRAYTVQFHTTTERFPPKTYYQYITTQAVGAIISLYDSTHSDNRHR